MPECVAHRGFKAKFPENTILAFERAVEAGAAALETDVHLTQDDVVVLSHDATLRRCFGKPDRILDQTWDEIKDLRTLAGPHVPMPRLRDLLDCLVRPGMEHIWVCVDVKIDNDAERVMRLIGATVAHARPSPDTPWRQRIVLGIWAAEYLPFAARYLPGFPVIHIGFHIPRARRFFALPRVGFSMLLPTLMAPGGGNFIRECQTTRHRQLWAWTANARDQMEWCIRRKLDAVITDDPELFLDVCATFDPASTEPSMPVGVRSLVEMLRMYIVMQALFWLFRRRLGSQPSTALMEEVPKKDA